MFRIASSVALLAIAVGLAACPKKPVTIYRSLSEPGAMQTCDANQRFRVEEKGATEAESKANGEAKIRATVEQNQHCAAFIYNEGAGKALDGHYNYAADYQLCKCGK